MLPNSSMRTLSLRNISYILPKISEEKTEKEYVLCGKYNCSMILQMQELVLLNNSSMYSSENNPELYFLSDDFNFLSKD